MADSILNTIKKLVGVPADYKDFDLDIVTHINSTFSTLHQIGIGPTDGFMIEDDESTWDEFVPADARLNSVKTYIALKVRLLFDPPTVSHAQAAMQEQVKELEWRLNVVYENDKHGARVEDGYIFDGGSA